MIMLLYFHVVLSYGTVSLLTCLPNSHSHALPIFGITLCPKKVPIQSPVVPDRSMGCPSLLALTKKYPSGVTPLQKKHNSRKAVTQHHALVSGEASRLLPENYADQSAEQFIVTSAMC
jgi:hypothetical protein